MHNIPMLSDNFSYLEGVMSDTAMRHHIPNAPSDAVLAAMHKSAMGMERVRAVLGNKPVHISSWYRCVLLNRLLGSKDSSQHVIGEAIDFICPSFGIPLAVCKEIIAHAFNVRFDQLILEHGWIHISFAISTGMPRNQVLSLLENGHYAIGLTDTKGVPL